MRRLALLIVITAVAACAHVMSDAEIDQTCTVFAKPYPPEQRHAEFNSCWRREVDERERTLRENLEARRSAAFALGVVGRAMQQQPRTVVVAPSCSSDFDCGFGNVCVKRPYSFSGFCARAVDDTDTPTYQAPRGDSIGPGQRECYFSTECPFGFTCAEGHCLQ